MSESGSPDLGFAFQYDETIENALSGIEKLLRARYTFSKRMIALLLLQEDEEITKMAKLREANFPRIFAIIQNTRSKYKDPLRYVVTLQCHQQAQDVLSAVMTDRKQKTHLQSVLDRITIQPLTGIPILLIVLYFGLYKFVGEFGAGTLVDLIEGKLFEAHINPWVNQVVENLIPWHSLQTLLAFDYGVITLGLRYAVAIILPIVGTFFLAFSLLEDSGYLPRLALLVDRIFKKIGLNGRAVIPMTLGFGCDTMATLVSRTLETNRERVIATLLLALAIPCSAQLGVILGLLSAKPLALAVWAGFVILVFLLVGYLAAKILPGERPAFYMELPPLRLPRIVNILEKTLSRMQWYFLEIIPFFILASVLIWAGKITGIFDAFIQVSAPLMAALGLPPQAAEVFLFGFFRRDYGAAGLYDLQKFGALSGVQIVVAAVTLTLFVPCIAQFAIMIKERGWKTALAIAGFIFPFAFLCGIVLNFILTLLGATL
jgi:ferrous iron transport protein B